MDENFENWEAAAPLPDAEAELKRIRRDIRKRNIRIVLVSLVLVAALLIGAVQFAVPAVEKLYWDPNTSTYLEDVPDLQLTMEVYTELFSPGYKVVSFDTVKTGFASHSISVCFSKWTDTDTLSLDAHRSAYLNKNELSLSDNFWGIDPVGVFGYGQTTKSYLEENAYETKKTLEKYPEYIRVLASITFAEDMNMEQLEQFLNKLSLSKDTYAGQGTLIWVNIRNADPSDKREYPSGFSPMSYIIGRDDPFGRDSAYPYLSSTLNAGSTAMETHFKSMLKFSQDQVDKGTGILPSNGYNPNYYQDVLDYVEENGVNALGGYIIATPQRLLDLMENDAISGVYLCDAWIGV